MGLPIFDKQRDPHETRAPHDAEKEEAANNLAGVKRRIGIHSGKGGVGKTFLAVNIAAALAASGKTVGLLDADVDCPNVAKFLGLRDLSLRGTQDGRIFPMEYRGVQLVSAHFLTDNPKEPMVIRGPIKHKILAEFLSRVEWGKLDVLLYDLPPGTADVPMSSMQIGNLTGMVIVTTPQKTAIMDARKSALMAKEFDVPILGIVENMSGEVFGEGMGRALATELGVPFLGSIPLTQEIHRLNERGKFALLKKQYEQSELLRVVAGADDEFAAQGEAKWRWPFPRRKSQEKSRV